MNPAPLATSDTPARWPLRAWFFAEVLFALASSSAVLIAPQSTATNFAWPIQPAVVAAIFGAIYFSALLLMFSGLLTRTWERARVVVLPSAIFTAVMLLPTFVHIDRFATGSISFAIWLASYVLPPPVFVACYIWQQKRSMPVGTNVASPLAGFERAFLIVNGAALLAFSTLVMALPSVLQAVAPVTFTPLTARAFAGFVSLAALLQLSMAMENDRLRARLATILLIPLPFAVLFQMLRFADQVQWSNPALWIFLVDAAAAAAISARMWLNRKTGA